MLLINFLSLAIFIIHSLSPFLLSLTGIDVAGCTANQVTIDLQNQEFTQIDNTDLTAIIRSGKANTSRHIICVHKYM